MEEGLNSSIDAVKGVGPKLSKLLHRKGISTLEDALFNFPRGYEDRRRLTPMANLQPGQTATVLGRVVGKRAIRRGRQMQFEATIADSTGRLNLFWFRAFPSLEAEFAEGELFLIYGEVSFFAGQPKITHPDYEKVHELHEGKPKPSYHFGRVVPIYSETDGLHQKTLRKVMAEALKTSLPQLDETLPKEMLDRLNLPSIRESFVGVHFPTECPPEGKPSPGLARLAFEEFFVLQLGLGLKKLRRKREIAPELKDSKGLVAKFVTALPFELTGDQKKSIVQIVSDLAKPSAMTRLVQGDVGSGKTVVGFAAACAAASAGYQTAMMAPTEILAQQHLKNAEKWLTPLGMKAVLISQGASDKKAAVLAAAEGTAALVIGTHALFQADIAFKNLGLVIVDEQHRFGVEQRGELVRKGKKNFPHMLHMTATPIPRTLALTLYGDLDLTIIREKPASRLPIKTRCLRDRDRPQLYKRMKDTLERGEQVYVIYPLVEASEKLDLKSATEMHARLSKEVFPGVPVALLHGRMKAEEKDRVLAEFKEGKWRMLVSTTVIEVGIDVPNATLMVIEHPDRLGLSQLHQLRGRVGRGTLSSECLLVVDQFISPRLQVMEATEDGFEIAEEDLKLRGPGEFLGTRQSGLPGFRAGHILRDADLLTTAREEADRLLGTDPELREPANSRIRELVESRWKEKIARLRGA